MKIMHVEKVKLNTQTYYTQQRTKNNATIAFQSNSNLLTAKLEQLATLNKPFFSGKNYEIGLSTGELVDRTLPFHLTEINLLSEDSPQYQKLEKGDKLALVHLVKAANIIDDIELQLDDENNVPFRNYLVREIAKGNTDATRAKRLFDSQRGIFAQDKLFHHYSLAKGLNQAPGRGVYPRDLDVVEFHETLREMLEKGMDEEVKNILTQRTVVVRDGKYLKGIDYVDKFKTEFSMAAEHLEKAAEVSTNKDFNEYLRLQAEAFKTADPMLDAKADIKWATLQDTPLDFTLSRENYEDKFTQTISENEELSAMLKERGITPIPKDFLGARVAIVDKKGTEFLKQAKAFMPILAQMMPYKNEYQQVITTDNSKQTSVDLDLVIVTGDLGASRGKLSVANNLPNSDKLALSLGGGCRNAYHKQMRFDKRQLFEAYTGILENKGKKYITGESMHYFTVGHENAHTLGPKNVKNLGKYRNIIEENKADVAAIAFVDKLTQLGLYSKKEREGILLYFVTQNFLPAKPDMAIAHRVRQVMQAKYFEENGVYKLTSDGKLKVDLEKVVPTAQKMLQEVIRIQVDDSYEAAEEFVNKHFVWTPTMQSISKHLRSSSTSLNSYINTPLADKLARQ
ncbi:MAG: hypothetical protein E7Z93_01965 [Cyanobacteria bacterium SIG32]|nr:hypothetical protein [Cyanobacteria bacterium SIG32]